MTRAGKHVGEERCDEHEIDEACLGQFVTSFPG
jgi:hypothetical protein